MNETRTDPRATEREHLEGLREIPVESYVSRCYICGQFMRWPYPPSDIDVHAECQRAEDRDDWERAYYADTMAALRDAT